VFTPNMDALAASSALFTNAYVPQNHCRPSLQTLMTATLPTTYNKQVDSIMRAKMSLVRFDSEESAEKWKKEFQHHAMQYFETLPRKLAKLGYKSFQGGKWWEFNYQNGGFSHGMTTGWTEEDRKKGGKWFKQFMGGTGLQLARATMEPVYEFIDNNKENPFFIWYAPELPHYPFDAPGKYYDLYVDKDMTESAKRYYANCSWFDDGVGALMNYLKDEDLFSNTLFVYVNDNGWEQNPDQEFRHDSLRWHNGGDKGKLSVFDQSFRTPILFSWEGNINPGRFDNALVHSADIPATIMDILNLDQNNNYGRSLLEMIESGKEMSHRDLIVGYVDKIRWEGDMMGKDVEAYWLREGNWFFSWNMTFSEKKLFDTRKDPRNELELSAKYPDLVDRFTDEIISWKKKIYEK
ncbi:MAG: sulfatase-like hydrolase/transferase, partial [Bacteroidia bacterium]|nr:sulfatase-like hydrolase/transferase [Bacteroidia bacterium]